MSKHALLFVFLIVCAISETIYADPMRYPYWQMIKEVVNTVETQQPKPLSISENNRKTDIEYPFELLRHLRATDLLRAASEGAQEARLQAALGKSEREIEALVLNNVALALEYLPMLIRSESDVEELDLLLANRNEDKILRLFLLQNTFPGFAPRAFLSLSLPEIIPDNDKGFLDAMLQIATHPSEHPELQCVAIHICYSKLLHEYENALKADPALVQLMKVGDFNNVVSLAMSMPEALSKDTLVALKECRRQLHDFAFDIAGHIFDGSTRDEHVKEATRQVLEEMRDSIIGINKEILSTFLAGKPYRSTPFPKMPSEDVAEEGDTISTPIRLDELLEKKSAGQ